MSNNLKTMTGRISTFWSLYNEKIIYIPKIQRDYVQGRKNVQVISNRGEFVAQLINALEKKTPLMLNFIYGYNDENRFVPIDGQQRLTTLYLLHIYLAKMSGKSGQLKAQNFIYDTRYTTKTFFEKLIDWEQGWDVETIKDTSWYSADWDNDQSIRSCCSVLQEIHQQMKEKTSDVYEQYFSALTSEVECPITFMLCDISDGVDKPNQLYIRMNARGKQLTAFENFKADMYSYLEEKNSDIKKDLVGNMDGDWLDLLWKLEDTACAEKYCDIFYRELLHWIIVNRFSIVAENKKDLLNWTEDGKCIDQIYFDEYKNFNEKTLMNAFRDMSYTLNILSTVSEDTGYFNKIKNGFFRYIDNKGKYSTPINTYPGRARLFAMAKFGRALSEEKQSFDIEKFKAWYRIMNNLISNAEINNIGDMQKVLKGIEGIFNDVVLDVSKIDTAKSNLKNIPPFKDHIVEEEIFKQKIIDKDKTWKDRIEAAEEISFFAGEIRFIFNALGVTSENEISDKGTKFEDAVRSVEAWTEMKGCTLLRLLYANMENINDCFYEESRFYVNVEKHNNYDVRGLLREKKGFEALQLVLEDMKDTSYASPQSYAKAKLSNSTPSLVGSVQEVFVRHLICYPELIEFCEQGRFFEYGDKNKIYLIKGRYHQNMPEYISYVKFIKKPDSITLNELPNVYSDTLLSHNYDYEKNGKKYKVEYQDGEYKANAIS